MASGSAVIRASRLAVSPFPKTIAAKISAASLWTCFNTQLGQSAFRFITVDAYLSAIPFYKKNGFVELTQKEEDDYTRLMYFDMMEMD